MPPRIGYFCTASFTETGGIDDADCREDADLVKMTSDVRAATGKADLDLVVLLAFPEIEAWLLSDWEQGFGAHYASISVPLRRHLQAELLDPRGLDWDHIEDYGGPPCSGSCTHKLSSDVQHALRTLPAGPKYSKQLDGPPMLMRVRPAVIAAHCPRARRALTALSSAP